MMELVQLALMLFVLRSTSMFGSTPRSFRLDTFHLSNRGRVLVCYILMMANLAGF